MNIFITGGSGFLGSHTIRRLIADGHKIYALARSARSAETVKRLSAEPVMGDLSCTEAMIKGLQDSQVVVHCAAPVTFWGPWNKFENEIHTSTIKLAKISAKHGVKRFIYI